MCFVFFSTIFFLRDKYDKTLIFCFAWCNLKILIIPQRCKGSDINISDCQRSCLSQS